MQAAQVTTSPQKDTNWFEQMLQTQESKNVGSPNLNKGNLEVQNQNQKVGAGFNQGYSQPFQTLSQNNPTLQPQPQYQSPPQPSFKK